MLALTTTAKSPCSEIDAEKFESMLSILEENPEERRKDLLGTEENTASTLQLLAVKGFPRLLPEGILVLVDYCRYLRELSLSYSLLSDELLLALSTEQQLRLETLRLEAHPENKPLPRITDEAWYGFADRLPNINLVVLSYMTSEEDQSKLLQACIPTTHLYFGEVPTEGTLSRIGQHCPRLMELVIACYGPGLLDAALPPIGRECPRLTALGLGECEITCSAFLEFVASCARNLQILYVQETSLIEDSEFDIATVSSRVSSLLGRAWIPEYVPLW